RHPTMWTVPASSGRSARQKQAAVPELVPQVPSGYRRVVRPLDQLATGHGLEQEQVRGLGFVQPGDEPVDHPGRPARPEEQAGPAEPGACPTVLRGNGFQRSYNRGTDRDHPAAVGPYRVDEPCGRCRYPEPFRLWSLTALQ